MARRLREQKKAFRKEMELALSHHREDCRAWRDSIVGEQNPLPRRNTAPRGVERLDSDVFIDD